MDQRSLEAPRHPFGLAFDGGFGLAGLRANLAYKL